MMVNLRPKVGEQLRRVKHELSESHRVEYSFSDTVEYLIEFWRKTKDRVEIEVAKSLRGL